MREVINIEDMNEAVPPSPLLSLTADTIRGWQRDRAAEQVRMAECAARIEMWTQKLSAVAILLDEKTRRELFGVSGEAEGVSPVLVSPTSVPSKGKRSIESERKDWMLDLIRDAGNCLTETEIWKQAQEHPLSSGPEETSRTIRALVENLSRRGRLRRRGPYIYHPEVLNKIELGEIDDRPDASTIIKSDIRELIRKALSEIGDAPAKSIIAQLWKMDEALPVMRRNPQYPYAMLSRMALSGELDREGTVYSLPPELSGVETKGSFGNTDATETES